MRILVVDDEPTVCEVFLQVLVPDPVRTPSGTFRAAKTRGPDGSRQPREDYEVCSCGDAATAVEVVTSALAAGNPYGLVFMDIVMPGAHDGVWAAEQIRKLDPDIEIVMVTANTELDPFEISQRVPPAEKLLYLHKPCHPHEIAQCALSLGTKWQTSCELRKSYARWELAQRLAKLGHLEWEPESDNAVWSPEVCTLFDLASDMRAGRLHTLTSRIHVDDSHTVLEVIHAAARDRTSHSIQFRLDLEDADERTVQMEVLGTSESADHTSSVVCALQDVSERAAMERKVSRIAYYDAVTKMPNRTFMMELLARTLVHARRHRQSFAVMFLDLDDFKRINDNLGHDAGDVLLQAVGDRLRQTVRSTDLICHGNPSADPTAEATGDTVARLGGDEFVMLLSNIKSSHDPVLVANRAIADLEHPVRLGSTEVTVGTSIGIAVYPDDGSDVETLLKCADVAMYHAKRAGKNQHQFYAPTLNEAASKRFALESALRAAIQNDELVVHYQPKMDLSSGALVGAEALVRWHRDKDTLVPPGDFIPAAEQSGLIVPLGEWVVNEVCRQLAEWQAASLETVPVAINISLKQFRNRDMLSNLLDRLGQHGIASNQVEIEITESTLMQNAEFTYQMLTMMREAGLKLGMDDFGTGYSSLGQLKRLPLDHLKIDRSFVSDITVDDDDQAIVAAIVAMSHRMDLTVVAEGVERPEQVEVLRRERCDVIQGFLISRALPAEEFAAGFLHQPSLERVSAY